MVLTELVRSKRSVPNDAAHDLLRLLSNKLATETAAQRRMARLGSLLDMVATGTGEFISSPAYDAARDAAGEHGREYPSAAELGRYTWPLEFFWFAASLSVSLTLFSIPVYTLEPIPSLGDTAYLGLGVLVWSAVLEMVDRGERLARYQHGAGGGSGSFPWVRFLALVVVEVLIYTLSRSHPMIHDAAVRGFFYGVVLAAAADLVTVVYASACVSWCELAREAPGLLTSHPPFGFSEDRSSICHAPFWEPHRTSVFA
jgi:hypothetical protein